MLGTIELESIHLAVLRRGRIVVKIVFVGILVNFDHRKRASDERVMTHERPD